MHEVVEGLRFDPRTRVRGELHFCKDVLRERERGEETERREREESKREREREGEEDLLGMSILSWGILH